MFFKLMLKSRQVPSPPHWSAKTSPKSSLACYGIGRTPTRRPERHCAPFPSPWHLQLPTCKVVSIGTRASGLR
ncbi:hypothetical protein CGRA01v4_05842 [Colletotrichum graminicola]|nr:hypothetical protein CGRA01v4_05842 [Colletotrichum graminicola]